MKRLSAFGFRLSAALLLFACKEQPTQQQQGQPAKTAAPAAGGLRVGGIFDLTGITSDVGKSFAKGVQDGVQFANDSGGINGKKIDLHGVDYGREPA